MSSDGYYCPHCSPGQKSQTKKKPYIHTYIHIYIHAYIILKASSICVWKFLCTRTYINIHIYIHIYLLYGPSLTDWDSCTESLLDLVRFSISSLKYFRSKAVFKECMSTSNFSFSYLCLKKYLYIHTYIHTYIQYIYTYKHT